MLDSCPMNESEESDYFIVLVLHARAETTKRRLKGFVFSLSTKANTPKSYANQHSQLPTL